jgi:hypothetical protein
MKYLISCIIVICLLTTGCTTIKPFESLDKSCPVPVAIFNNDANSPVKSIRFTGVGGTAITYSEVNAGWTQVANLPTTVTWMVPTAGLPVGNPVPGVFRIWIRAGSGNLVNVEFLDGRGNVVCSRQMIFNCKGNQNNVVEISCGGENENCCQFALRLFNNVPNTFKQIKITPLNPSSIAGIYPDVDEDDDAVDWSLAQSGTAYTLTYINTGGSGFIPADAVNFINADFTIKPAPGSSNPKVLVSWIDANGNSLKTEEITLVCKDPAMLEDENYEYDWTVYTTSTSGTISDSLLFAGAEALPCSAVAKMMEVQVVCPTINHTLSCQNNQLILTLSCATVSGVPSPSYHWIVDGTPLGAQGTSVATPLYEKGQTTADVLLEVHGISPQTGNDSVYCTQPKTIPYCRPDAEFMSTPPDVVCNAAGLAGWDVSFIHATSCTNIASYSWNYGDGTPVVNQSGPVTDPVHRYTTGGTYYPKLTITDLFGCTYVYTGKVVTPTSCEPDFHITYEWCEDGQNKDTKYPVKVEFTNLSPSFCGTTFMWDYGDGSAPDASGVHTYNTKPGENYKVTLTMTDAKMCPSGKSITYDFDLKPVSNNMSVVACPDGIVKFSNPCNVYWQLPNWELLTQDPSYYCLPSPFHIVQNVILNGIMGKLGNSIPQLWVNAMIKSQRFELRMKDGASFVVTSTCFDNQGKNYVTGICTKSKKVEVHITCCIDNFNKSDIRYTTINGKDYRMKIRFKTHYRERHSALGLTPGACMDFYLSALIDQKTHVVTRTLFQRQRKIGKLKYWTWSIADIETGVTDPGTGSNFLTVNNTDGCNCTEPVGWGMNKHKPNRIVLTCRGNTPKLYRIDRNKLLQSYHKIVKNGVPWVQYIDKPAGYCSPQ